jgi:hypothetical protein
MAIPYFTVESIAEPINGKMVDQGFKLSGEIRLYGDAPERSSRRLQSRPQTENIKGLDGTITRPYYRNSERAVAVRHADRNSLECRSGTDYREYLIFYQNHTVLPFNDKSDAYPPQDMDQNSHAHVSLADYPGRWECQWLDSGKLMRTFAWSVDNNGQLVPHPEQRKGLTLNPGAILVDTYILESGTPFDARIVPEIVEQGGFYGWKWKSERVYFWLVANFRNSVD